MELEPAIEVCGASADTEKVPQVTGIVQRTLRNGARAPGVAAVAAEVERFAVGVRDRRSSRTPWTGEQAARSCRRHSGDAAPRLSDTCRSALPPPGAYLPVRRSVPGRTPTRSAPRRTASGCASRQPTFDPRGAMLEERRRRAPARRGARAAEPAATLPARRQPSSSATGPRVRVAARHPGSRVINGHLAVDLHRRVGAGDQDRAREAAGGDRRARRRVLVDRELIAGAGVQTDCGELVHPLIEELLVDLQIVGAGAGDSGQHRQGAAVLTAQRRDGADFPIDAHCSPNFQVIEWPRRGPARSEPSLLRCYCFMIV